MMAQKRRAANPTRARAKDDSADDKKPIEFLPPLKPHPKLMIVLGILLLGWLVVLLMMRLRTIQHSPRIDGDTPPAAQP